MGRTAYLATPPSSTILEPRASECLPELSLGPARLQHDSSGSLPRSNQHVRADSSSYTYNAKSSSSTEAVPKPIARKSKPSRKTTHSQIEKRRREKINDTMQRLKDLVPACHDQDLLLRKLDVLTATADYIEELQTSLYGRPMPLSPASLPKTASDQSMQFLDSAASTRRSSRTQDGIAYAESSSSVDDRETKESRTTSRAGSQSTVGRMEVDDVHAAESLLHISESPMLRPVERQRLSISELMCLD